ncbi:diiron oxygenase [Gordonia sp. X0973]|uniref:diiron oxygenase n=1 Tax=Gordonia sp. X0973 TaxID=2742602 RepID=UPI000F51F020|nr:diiron oxygenase [Gordonia sp. X0973]QKT08492.1 diiron oxygenase [Gordonia sp. X0973]
MNTEFYAPTTTDGAAITRRRSIVDRQATAQRFLFEAAEDVFDGDLDIDWDAPPVAGRRWLPDQMVTLFGTPSWSAMEPEKRADLARRELVDLLTVAVYAETVLSMLTFRDAAEERAFADDRTRWQLKCIDTRARNISMFGRLIDITDVRPYLRPKLAKRLERYTLLLPAGATTATVNLLLESALQGLAELISADPDLQPHVAQIMEIQLGTGRRHVQYAREELTRVVASRGAARRAGASIAGAAVVSLIGRLMVNPAVYRDLGLAAHLTAQQARSGPARRRRMDAAFADAVRFAADAGLFRDRTSRAILRRNHLAPTRMTDVRS